MSGPAQQYAEVTAQVGKAVATAEDRKQAAYQATRAGLMALLYYLGPEEAAETAYRLADEMADACRVAKP